ncbi:MAG: hypothetical protein J0M34_00770 [Alphaproteobacteria bacterium]|nr:hypothetical protein [Alphaproteobacteria bacterium]
MQPSPEMEEVWQSTRKSVKALLETLAKGIDSPATMPEHWERLFGTKDSAVANLQKLVALLIELRQHFHDAPEADVADITRIEAHELEMLEAWLEKQKPTEGA